MKKDSLVRSDTFSFSPLLALLPVLSRIENLKPLTSFFYARYEKISALRRSVDSQTDSDSSHAFLAEQAMLQEVLEWLGVDLSKREGG